MMDVDQVLGERSSDLSRRRVRLTVAGASALAVLGLLSGCGTDEAAPETKASTSGVPVYFVDQSGKLASVEQQLAGADKMRSQGKAVAAVEALLTVVPEKDSKLKSHWGGPCGVGTGVESLQKDGPLITLRVRGAAGVACDVKGAEVAQQRQQLAWTIVENLGVDPTTPVRMYGPNGAVMFNDVVADEKFLAG